MCLIIACLFVFVLLVRMYERGELEKRIVENDLLIVFDKNMERKFLFVCVFSIG